MIVKASTHVSTRSTKHVNRQAHEHLNLKVHIHPTKNACILLTFKYMRILKHKPHENFRTQVHIPKIYKSSRHSIKIIKACVCACVDIKCVRMCVDIIQVSIWACVKAIMKAFESRSI